MYKPRGLLCFGIAFVLAGCGVRPLPQDVTGYNTYDIVQKIRCETRDAIKAQLIDVLLYFDPVRAQALVSAIEAETIPVHALHQHLAFDRNILLLYSKYAASGITYAFTFDISVDDDETGSLLLRDPLTRSTVNLALKAGKESQRNNKRTFTITENFTDIFVKLSKEYCSERTARIGNVFYPITGRIGVHEVVDTFTSLDYRSRTDDQLKVVAAKPVLSQYFDTITFETRVFAGLDPGKIELVPLTKKFHVAEAQAKLFADRKDIHSVKIGLTGPDSLQLDPRFVSFAPQTTKAGVQGLENAVRLKGLLDLRENKELEAGERTRRDLDDIKRALEIR